MCVFLAGEFDPRDDAGAIFCGFKQGGKSCDGIVIGQGKRGDVLREELFHKLVGIVASVGKIAVYMQIGKHKETSLDQNFWMIKKRAMPAERLIL